MSEHFTPDRLAVLRAVCDTVVPSLQRADDPHGLWARAASDVGVDVALADMLRAAPDEDQAGLGQLLDGLAAQGFMTASQLSREQLLRNMSLAGAAAAGAIAQLVAGTLYLHYGLPDPVTGQNPAWPALGFPGPVSAAPRAEKPIRPYVPAAGEDELTADVVIVGSGAGGGVIAGELSAAGLDVELPAHEAVGPPGVGGRARPGRRRRARLRRAPGRRPPTVLRDGRVQRPQRPDAADARGGPSAGLVVQELHPEHRPGDLQPGHRRLHGLR